MDIRKEALRGNIQFRRISSPAIKNMAWWMESSTVNTLCTSCRPQPTTIQMVKDCPAKAIAVQAGPHTLAAQKSKSSEHSNHTGSGTIINRYMPHGKQIMVETNAFTEDMSVHAPQYTEFSCFTLLGGHACIRVDVSHAPTYQTVTQTAANRTVEAKNPDLSPKSIKALVKGQCELKLRGGAELELKRPEPTA